MRRGFAPWADPVIRPLVRFEQVSKRFGPVAAVDGLSLGIYEGEFFALLGPSGCGKTTLLRMLAGFETPDQGRILLGDDDIGRVPPYRRPVNMMFQSYALFPHLTVAGNVAFGLRQEGLPRPEIAGRVAEMLALVKLDGLSGRKPHQLSGGQRQRVALARSLAKRPKVLLLDEPLAALDKKLRAETQLELMELQARLGTTFVIVTHDQEEAMTVAHRIAVMDRGRLVQVATPPELYEQPNSRWVAGFIGDVNLIEGAVVAADAGALAIEGAGGRRYVAGVAGAAGAPKLGQKVWIALRPEKLCLGAAKPATVAENCVAGRVHDIAYLGDVSLYRVRLDDGSIMTASLANASRRLDRPIGWDDTVWLSWAPDAGAVLTS
ncbi:MAG TPA: ABC transporter ATP-binding protein [Xanthobacteraceae bacterium]|jgi:putrescine transport system ATP-binding protein|nr:ABC transporter ATP-binding protein [Xanthobacteraceae bacterium]